ncbi:MAG: elongation factor G [Myxococcota bacterium]
MNRRSTENMRNVALVGHSGVGKTTLAEALLGRVGQITRIGTVEEGNTVSDFEPEEKAHGHSINSSFLSFEYEGSDITLVDTPGFPDLIGQTLCTLPAVECAAIVVSADKGVQSMTRRLMRVVEKRNLPHILIVNKIDQHIGELEALLGSLEETFGGEVLPINLPTPDGEDLVDLWEKSEGDLLFSNAAEAHQRLVDQCIESDETLMETYLAKGHLTRSQMHDAFEAALRQAHLVPVCFASARTGLGLDQLLHTIAYLCPSPLEGNPRRFLHRDEAGEEETWFPRPDANETPVAHVFKVSSDPFVGKLSMLKVHQGTFSASTDLYLDGIKKPLKPGHILRLNGKKQDEIPEALPGDVVAVAKLEDLRFDSVLHGQDIDHLRLVPLDFPRPMYGLAIRPRETKDEKKFSSAMQKLLLEDPTLSLERVGATEQLVLRSLGELHMRIVLEKLENRFNIQVDTEPPKVPYRETIRGRSEGHHRHKKQTGGAGQFGEVYLRIEPLEGEEPLEFIDETVGGSVPRQFMPAIEKGIRKAMSEGAIAGYPICGVRVRVYDGKHHSVDSKEVAFVAAGRRAFLDAVKKASPTILEPIVNVEVTAPAEFMGDVNALLAGKRGHLKSSDYLPGERVLIHAQAPLGEMAEFSSQLKSMTHGRGTFVVDESHYAPAPAGLQAELQSAYRPEAESD